MNVDRILVRVGAAPLDARELERFVATPASGGITVFVGAVRNRHEGREVVRIEYEAALPLAAASLESLARDALRDPGVHRAAAVHRVGVVEVGEASVIVAASAAHRDESFRAARFLIDRIKEVLPVWKREHFADGTAEWAPGFAVRPRDRAGRPSGTAGC